MALGRKHVTAEEMARRRAEGELVRRLMEAQGRTPRWVAAQLGLKRDELNNRLRRTFPSPFRALERRELSRLFDVPVECLERGGPAPVAAQEGAA